MVGKTCQLSPPASLMMETCHAQQCITLSPTIKIESVINFQLVHALGYFFPFVPPLRGYMHKSLLLLMKSRPSSQANCER